MAANPILGGIFKSPVIEQIFVWQVLQQITAGLLASVVGELEQTSWHLNQGRVLSPADAVDALIKGHMARQDAVDEATWSGISKERFAILEATAGEPLPLQALLEAMRRGFILDQGLGPESTSLQQGVYESRLKNKWLPVIEKLQWQLANPGTVIEGWLRAQIGEADAREILRKNGIDEATATLMYKSAGRPPSPDQLLTLWHRGKIPLEGEGGDTLSVRQGFLETDLKNKWWPVFPALGDYLPPPRTVTAMLREGALTEAQAADLFHKAGLPDDLKAAYLAAAHHQKTQASKDLTKADAIAAYQDGLLPRAGLEAVLHHLGWTAEAAALEVEMADFRRRKGLLSSAITLIRSRYIARKITKSTTTDALASLGVSVTGVSQYLAVWDVERQNLVLRLTPAQWGRAVKKGFITAEQGLSQLQGMGYTPFEAWVLLSDELGDKATPTAPPADLPASYTQSP